MANTIKYRVFFFLRLAIGGLFLYAAVVKIWDFKSGGSATPQFAEDIQNYHLVSWTFSVFGHRLTAWSLSMLTAVYLPWLELAAGLALLTRRFRAGAVAILTGLTVFFLIALSSAWARGLNISCGCFGKEHVSPNFPAHIAGDLALLAALLAIGWQEFKGAEAPHRVSPL